MAEFPQGGVILFTATAASNAVTATLTQPPAGMVNKILWITCYATAATAADVQVQKADTTILTRIGGVGTAILDKVHVFGGSSQQPTFGVTGAAADATKVILTTTAGTSVGVFGSYINVPA